MYISTGGSIALLTLAAALFFIYYAGISHAEHKPKVDQGWTWNYHRLTHRRKMIRARNSFLIPLSMILVFIFLDIFSWFQAAALLTLALIMSAFQYGYHRKKWREGADELS
ncbi:hypothetical protein [Alkalicoccus chagannorensis]|uniref:hypothetical protein n=1 Tax=Alkalicoccus chagannorensis TaxID=427072 RepID=UPI0004146BDC|nr:hypothetical protein [Alkalicoccus chagannorensis]